MAAKRFDLPSTGFPILQKIDRRRLSAIVSARLRMILLPVVERQWICHDVLTSPSLPELARCGLQIP